MVHILPTPASIHSPRDTQPTDAPPSNATSVYPASYSSGALIDHGGLEISSAGFQAVYWHQNVANSTATSLGYATVQAQVGAFISAFQDGSNWDNSATDDYSIIQQYGSTSHIAPTLTSNPANGGSPFVDTQSSSTTKLSDSQVQS